MRLYQFTEANPRLIFSEREKPIFDGNNLHVHRYPIIYQTPLEMNITLKIQEHIPDHSYLMILDSFNLLADL